MILIKVRLMRNKLLIFVFLSLVFLSPLFIMGWESPIGDDTSYEFPLYIDNEVYVDLEWGDEGDLIYWHLEVSGEVVFYFINSSKVLAEPIFITVIEAGNMHEYNITLPYKDTFHFFIKSKGESSITVDGWYAKDETEPVGEMWGIDTNFADEVLIGSTATFTCKFWDSFDIVNMLLYENDAMVRTFYGPADTMIEWTIFDYEFTTLGIIEMVFKAEDQGRNVGIVSKTVEVVNKLSLPPTTSEREYFDWVGIFENYWYIIIPVGAVVGIVGMFGLEKAGILH